MDLPSGDLERRWGCQLRMIEVGPEPRTQVKPESGKLCRVHGWLPEPLPPAWSPFSVITFHYLALP